MITVYSLPAELPAPEPDYSNYNHANELRREEEHKAKLAEWLKSHGYAGKHTGRIYAEGVADGHALYMVADGRKFALIHLPYGDAYQSRNVRFLTKTEVLRRLGAEERLAKAFEEARKQAK